MIPFVQRKKNQEMEWAARPSSLNNLPFLGHAKLGGIHIVYFDNGGHNRVPIPGNQGPTRFDFEISTLTLEENFRFVSYQLNGNRMYVPGQLQQSDLTTSPIVFALLVNILRAGIQHPFEPDSWHECKNKGLPVVAGKFGCPRLAFGFNDELIVLRHEGDINVIRYYDPVTEKYILPFSVTYKNPYLVALTLPNQHLVYYIVEDIESTLQTWHNTIEMYRGKEDNNLFASAESPILFDDKLQMFLCETVIIKPSEKPPPTP